MSIDAFDKAMETVFYGVNREDYSGLIEKIYDYRNNVQLKFEEDVKRYVENGIEFSNIVKYGLQTIPITNNSNELSDATVTVRESSFGATATEVEEKFSDDYISAAVENQTARYISPDCQVDASTCLLPDTTWFIKDLYHKDFPLCVNGFVSDIVNNKNFNVYSNPEYTQFLVYEKDTGLLVPMTSENLNTTERWNVTFFDALIKFFKNLVIILQNISDK